MIVTDDDVVAGFVPKFPVIPAGQLDATKVTAELKPLAGLIVTVDAFDTAGVALSVKLGAAVTVRAIVVLADSDPLVPFTVNV